jgi:hypothetical protein
MFGPVADVLADIERDMDRSTVTTPERFGAVMGTQAINVDFISRLSGLPQANALVVFGADGAQLNDTRAWPQPPVSVADRAYFRAAAEAGSPVLSISDPLLGRVSGKRVVFVLRRVVAPDGAFLGLLAASVRLDYLQDFYTAIDLPSGTAVAVLRRDGQVLTFSPPDQATGAGFVPVGSLWYQLVTGRRGRPALDETVGRALLEVGCWRRRQRGRFVLGAAEPVYQLDPGRFDHPHWSQGAAMFPEHVR